MQILIEFPQPLTVAVCTNLFEALGTRKIELTDFLEEDLNQQAGHKP